MAAKKLGTDFVKKIAKFATGTNSFDRVLKMIEITEGGGGRVLAEFTVAPEHLNLSGTLHGGLIALMVDNHTSYALMTHGCHPGVTANLNISYVAPAKSGEVVEIEAQTIRAGKKMAYLDCILRNKSNGRIIAKGVQVKYIQGEGERGFEFLQSKTNELSK